MRNSDNDTAGGHHVSPDDERQHSSGSEDLWGGSYYADFVQEDGTVAGWPRSGLYPNRDVAWWTAWIIGPDRAGPAGRLLGQLSAPDSRRRRTGG